MNALFKIFQGTIYTFFILWLYNNKYSSIFLFDLQKYIYALCMVYIRKLIFWKFFVQCLHFRGSFTFGRLWIHFSMFLFSRQSNSIQIFWRLVDNYYINDIDASTWIRVYKKKFYLSCTLAKGVKLRSFRVDGGTDETTFVSMEMWGRTQPLANDTCRIARLLPATSANTPILFHFNSALPQTFKHLANQQAFVQNE